MIRIIYETELWLSYIYRYIRHILHRPYHVAHLLQRERHNLENKVL